MLRCDQTHGKLTGTKNKTQKEINAEAASNFEKEMQKHKVYFRNQGIFTLIYTDSDLQDLDAIFSEIQKYLLPKNVALNYTYIYCQNSLADRV